MSREFIVCVAMVLNDEVYALPRPNRHHHLRDYLIDHMDVDRLTMVRAMRSTGFITSEGRYVGREEAHRLFVEAGQGVPEHRTMLFSEDLFSLWYAKEEKNNDSFEYEPWF